MQRLDSLACFAVADWQFGGGILVVALAIFAIAKQYDVRLVLFSAALFMAAMVGQTEVVMRKFIATFSDEKFVVPICAAMGFSYILRLTECDRHLVRLLVKPLLSVRPLLVPGTILVAFCVNMPVVSQTSTAVAIGSVVIPILRAARIPALTIGGAILLGSSIGGELFNPGAPELRTTIVESQKAATMLGMPVEVYDSGRCIERIRPLNFVGLAVAMAVFGWRSRRNPVDPEPTEEAAVVDLRVDYVKALVPIVPLVLLAVFAPGIGWWELPREWLEDVPGRNPGQFETRLIGAAMIFGAGVALLTSPNRLTKAADEFFAGAGYGFTHIVSLIVTANCFGEALKLIGVAEWLGGHLSANANLQIPIAGLASLAFATLCGSGMATAQSLFSFFAEPALRSGIDPTHVGAVVSLAAAAGRTMSPVSAVCLMTATLTGTKPLDLMKQVGPPLVIGTLAVIIAAMLRVPGP